MTSDEQQTSEGESPDSPLPATAEQAMRWKANPMLLQARFPRDLDDPTTLAQFLQVAIAVDLNPLMGELIPIHGRPYITEEGWLRMIDERAPGQLVGDVTSIAEKSEYEAFGVSKGWLGKAVVTRRVLTLDGKTTADRVVTDYAFLSMADVNKSPISAVKEEPWRQAMKTAHVRALRKAFRDVVARAASDFALGGGDDNVIDVEVMDQVNQLATSGAEQATDDTERKKFWARAPGLGLKHGGAEIAAFFGIPLEASIKDNWIDHGHTWMEANQMLSMFEEEGPCAQCGKGYAQPYAYTADGKGICGKECHDKATEELESANVKPKTKRPSRASPKK